MKKNRTMRAAALLLALTLMTSCFVGGTFAKYVSTASGTDSARVAKWDIIYSDKINGGEVDIAGDTDTITFDLFNAVYETDASTAEEHVAKGSDVMIIAPGTGGKFSLNVENKSEVDATIKLELSESEHGLPIEYSLDGTTYYDGFSEINEVNKAINLKYIGSGEDVTKKDITVYWRWAFEGKDSTNFTETQTDETDTAAGVAAQDVDQTITITANLTATQIN